MTTSLDTLLPGGKGVWIPIDHGITAYPEPGLNRMDALIPALIAGGADAIVAQKGIVADWAGRTNFNGFVAHLSVSTVHGGQRRPRRSWSERPPPQRSGEWSLSPLKSTLEPMAPRG